MSIDLTMPRLSDTMEVGTIIKWNVKVGDTVSSGDVVADIETDKATMEMQVYDDGVMAKILVDEGQPVDVGTLIAIVAEEDEDPASITGGPAPASNGAAATPVVEAPAQPAATQPAAPAATPAPEERRARTRSTGERLRISPVARRLADDHGVDIRSIQGSGPSGRIVKRDILAAVDAQTETAAAVPPSAASSSGTTALATPVSAHDGLSFGLQNEIMPLSQMRQTIARRLIESKQTIPHYQVKMRFDMEALLDLRRDLNAQLAEAGVKLSLNDFLVRACALAMHKHPEFNSSWGEDHLVVHGDVNIGVAVALPSDKGGGLVVATIRNADIKGLRMISAETKMLSEKARTRGLTVQEMSDSTFTISNLGMFGVDDFTAIINPPNSAILAVGAAQELPVVRDGQIVVGHEMAATLSLDHRIIDGAMAAQYLQTLKQLIESPAALLV